MNKVCLIGRLTAKPELRYNSSNIEYTRFCVAVNRNYTNENGEREADFINCVAWKERATVLSKYFDKGSQIGVEGHILTGSYENDAGERIYTTDIVVDNITFIDKKKDERPEPEYPGDDKPKDSDPFADFGEQVDMDNFLD